MSSIETLRGILVAGSVVAAIVALVSQMWLPAAVLIFAVTVHGVLTPTVRRKARVNAEPAPVVPPSDTA